MRIRERKRIQNERRTSNIEHRTSNEIQPADTIKVSTTFEACPNSPSCSPREASKRFQDAHPTRPSLCGLSTCLRETEFSDIPFYISMSLTEARRHREFLLKCFGAESMTFAIEKDKLCNYLIIVFLFIISLCLSASVRNNLVCRHLPAP